MIRTAKIDKERKGEGERELSVKKGDLVIVKSNPHMGWCLGELNGILGYFPISLSSDLSHDLSSFLSNVILLFLFFLSFNYFVYYHRLLLIL